MENKWGDFIYIWKAKVEFENNPFMCVYLGRDTMILYEL